MTVGELFKEAELSTYGPVQWGTEISEPCAGVYVVALAKEVNGRLECPVYANYLEERELGRWLQSEPIVYIGQTSDQTLSKRIRQFYSHVYGKRSPHRGGQAVKLLQCDRWVYWSRSPNPKDSEQKMIKAFLKRVGCLPFANRRR